MQAIKTKKYKVKQIAISTLVVGAILAVVVYYYWPITPSDNVPQLPATYSLDERSINIGHTFDVNGNGTWFGKLDHKWFYMHKTINYTDDQGKLVAYAQKAHISVGTRIDIYDGHGVYIGCLQKQVLNTMFSATSSYYSVLDAQGKELASSRKTTFITTGMRLQDDAGRDVVDIHRPVHLFGDSWEVTVHRPGVVDSRILVFIGPFKTLADSSK